MINVRGLTKDFGEVKVLKGIDQTIEKGEKLVIIGPSGSGKSTFLRCLNRLEEPTSGTIEFEGIDITSVSYTHLAPCRRRPRTQRARTRHWCP